MGVGESDGFPADDVRSRGWRGQDHVTPGVPIGDPGVMAGESLTGQRCDLYYTRMLIFWAHRSTPIY